MNSVPLTREWIWKELHKTELQVIHDHARASYLCILAQKRMDSQIDHMIREQGLDKTAQLLENISLRGWRV